MTLEITRPRPAGGTGASTPAEPREGRAPAATRARAGARARDPRLGYQLAALNAVISGFAVYLNSLGVKMFADSTLYTALKNGVVALVVVLPFLVSAARRQDLARLTRREWGLLVLIALVAGSLAYGLDFRGRQISTATTAAVIGHAEFLIVALAAAVFLRERFPRTVPAALLVLTAGLALGLRVHDVRLDAGVLWLAAGTLLFAAGAVLIKVALRTVPVAAVVGVKMVLGAALLFAYVAATGGLASIVRLSTVQWGFVLVTGLILLAFTVTAIGGLHHASATGVTAVSAGAPVVTAALVATTRRVPLHPAQLLSLGLVLTGVFAVYVAGVAEERRAAARRGLTRAR
ncbi:MAG TPA: DMT family transporter [bacterium]|nr:DMT family transporter [bacterium]